MNASSLRKVAIRVACAHPDDREWLLNQLTSEQRQQLEELLQEINLLGLAADPAIVSAVMNEPAEAMPLSTLSPGWPAQASIPAFWRALGLQALKPAERAAYLDGGSGKAALRKYQALSEQPMPLALLASLKAYLELQEKGNEQA